MYLNIRVGRYIWRRDSPDKLHGVRSRVIINKKKKKLCPKRIRTRSEINNKMNHNTSFSKQWNCRRRTTVERRLRPYHTAVVSLTGFFEYAPLRGL